jgi:hypothetical protein
MPAPLEAPHTLPSAPRLRPLPFYKRSAPVSPLFATLAKSAHPIHSTGFSHPLFSTTCALFCANENAMSFAFSRLRTLCAKHGGCGCSVCPFGSIFSASSRGWVSAISFGMNTYEKTGEGGPHFYVAQMIGSCFAMLVKSESLVISGALRNKPGRLRSNRRTEACGWL